MNIFIKYKRLLFVLFIVIIIIIITIFFIHKNKQINNSSEIQEINIETNQQKSGKFSRITFFHTASMIGSLAMPEVWEGKYRVKEDGNKVSFLYIVNPNKISPIFSIKFYKKNEWENLQGKKDKLEKEIKIKDDLVFVYILYSNNVYIDKEAIEFKEMLAQVKNIIGSFKSFKL